MKQYKHSKYKYTYYQNTHTLQNPHKHTAQLKILALNFTKAMKEDSFSWIFFSQRLLNFHRATLD